MTEFLNEWAWLGWTIGILVVLFGLVTFTLVVVVFVKVFSFIFGNKED